MNLSWIIFMFEIENEESDQHLAVFDLSAATPIKPNEELQDHLWAYRLIEVLAGDKHSAYHRL